MLVVGGVGGGVSSLLSTSEIRGLGGSAEGWEPGRALWSFVLAAQMGNKASHYLPQVFPGLQATQILSLPSGKQNSNPAPCTR